MADAMSLRSAVLESWQTSHRVTAFLVESLPVELWPQRVPGAPRRTVRMIAGHIHNCRCMWVEMLSKRTGSVTPARVDRYRVTPAALLDALDQSNRAVAGVIELALDRDGRLPEVPWLNLPPNIVFFVTYLSSHEAHHRGQIVMLARQLGLPLPGAVTSGLWQWSARAKEVSRQ